MSTLDNLKKEAKRWLKALRAGDVTARGRYARAYPNGPDEPGLRDLQQALAREHGQADWKAFTAAVAAGRPPETPLQELLQAADRQDAARVAEVLAGDPDLVNQRGRLPGHTGLRTALHFGIHNEAVVRTLLDRGADPNIRDEGDNAIPLHFAAEREELPIIRLLVEHGSDVIGDGDGHGLGVIGWATCFGKAREDVVEYLLAHGAQHNIFSAVATNDVDAIRALAAESRAVIDAPMDATNRRRRALHLAVVKKKLEALDVLLELGADVEARDEAGLTPLDQAAMNGETVMAERLIARGARIDLPAAIGLLRPADIERLLRDDPDCLKPGRHWGTLIVTAAERASGPIMETLIRAGASVNVKADPRTAVDEAEGYTALHAAAWHANRPAVEVLLSHGADVTAKDSKYDATPAGWADYAGHHEIRDLILGRSAVSANTVRTFLEFACWDHHTHGKGNHRMADRAAQRILGQHPDLASHSLYTAVVCGNLKEVRRILAERPEAAREPGGSRGWTPLLYLSYTRFTHPPTFEHALEIARLLLDHGANPNDFYMAGDSEYTCLVGAAGEGEQDSPRQPYAAALYRLLLERGAKPYDIQVLYNTHFSGDMLWWLELTYEHSVKTGRKADWDDPYWSMLGMGGYGSGNYFVLKVALDNEDLALAEWALSHGASPNIDTARAHRKFKPERTLYDEAVLRGATEFADLLRRHGAESAGVALGDEQTFAAACFRLDRDVARAMVNQHPEYLRSHTMMFQAAQRDRPDVIELLLDLGIPLEIADKRNTRALHHAASNNALRAAQCLIDRGAEIDPRETAYGAVPIGWAAHGDNQEMIDLLSRYSKDIWTLCFRGYVDRVRDILREDPSLARQVTGEGNTPLWWLPDDDEKAMAIVELLLAAGADPAVKNREGRTAADWARKRGMQEIARRLVAAGASEDDAAIEPPPDLADLSRYESLAEDLVVAYETGNPAAMRRLMRHFGGDVTWAQLRSAARQRLTEIGRWGPDEDYFGIPQARELIARQSGFDDWAALEASRAAGVKKDGMSPLTAPIVYPPPEPADVPIEMRSGFIQRLRDNSGVPTSEIWNLLMACRDGDLARVEALLTAWPTAIVADYNYMTPIHLAVREGHTEIVRYLAERGAVNPKYRTYPYNEPLRTVATDRGFVAIAAMLDEYGRNVDPDRPEEEGGHIEYVTDFERQRFQRLVGANARKEVEGMLERRAELATDPFAFWSEGILSMPSNRRDLEMIALLMRFGARVPAMTKWAAEYYFKHDDIAALLLERGMSARHANCHRTTLLHEMARRGALVRARLLLDNGAELDAVDEEFKSTPLGFAARWGQRAMVRLLLDRGADRRLAGADWATPMAWAREKGHTKIAQLLGA